MCNIYLRKISAGNKKFRQNKLQRENKMNKMVIYKKNEIGESLKVHHVKFQRILFPRFYFKNVISFVKDCYFLIGGGGCFRNSNLFSQPPPLKF